MTTSTDRYFVRLQKTLTPFKAICSIKSLINDKKAERLAKRRERRRQRLLEETAEEREAHLGKRREATVTTVTSLKSMEKKDC